MSSDRIEFQVASQAKFWSVLGCLPPTQGSFVTRPKIYARKLFSIYKILWHPDRFISRDSIIGLRADALVSRFLLVTETISS
jgi:hypothetical protein